MRVALDVEGVLADSHEACLQATDKLSRSDIYENWWPENPGDDLTWQIYNGVSDAVWRHNPQAIPQEEPNLRQYVNEINERATVDIVTARSGVDESIIWWLNEHGIEYEDFYSAAHPKWEMDGYDLYIDDNPGMHGECRLLLRHQPYNDYVKDNESKTTDRIYSLKEALEFVR